MHSHLVLLLTFAFFVSLVFALLSRDSPGEQVRFGALLMGLPCAGVVLGWLMHVLPQCSYPPIILDGARVPTR